ncbi:unnamed protein product [Symbiodinium sp. KB8]|nr:unnamed protein product [Symbiodinium sp. KB8]
MSGSRSAKGPDPAAGKRKVAPAPKLQMVRRQRRLLDPRTAAASRAAGLGAATMQRRMEQLVAAHLNVECLPVPVVSAETVGKDMALSVSTLEFFADRQPVEFGMTAVVELWLGPNQPLQSKAVKVPADKSQFVHTPTQGLRALKEAIAKLTGALKSEDVQVELSTAGSVAVTQPERPQGEVCCLFWIPAGDAMDELRQRVEQLDAKAFTQQFAANMLDVGLDVDASHLNVLEPFQASTASDPETGASLVRGSFKFAVRQQAYWLSTLRGPHKKDLIVECTCFSLKHLCAAYRLHHINITKGRVKRGWLSFFLQAYCTASSSVAFERQPGSTSLMVGRVR